MKKPTRKAESPLVLTRKTDHMLNWYLRLEERVTQLEELMKALKRLLNQHEETRISGVRNATKDAKIQDSSG